MPRSQRFFHSLQHEKLLYSSCLRHEGMRSPRSGLPLPQAWKMRPFPSSFPPASFPHPPTQLCSHHLWAGRHHHPTPSREKAKRWIFPPNLKNTDLHHPSVLSSMLCPRASVPVALLSPLEGSRSIVPGTPEAREIPGAACRSQRFLLQSQSLCSILISREINSAQGSPAICKYQPGVFLSEKSHRAPLLPSSPSAGRLPARLSSRRPLGGKSCSL